MRGWNLLLYGLSSVSFVGRIARHITEHIAADEEVILFPTLASQINNTHWDVPIHGWIYEPERDDRKRRAFLSLLRKALNLKKGDTETECFTRRAQWFLVDNERWKSPKIEILGQVYRVPVSAKNGHFLGNVLVSLNNNNNNNNNNHDNPEYDDDIKHSDGHFSTQATQLLPLATRAADGRVFVSHAHLVPNQGISVISDIDDTVKISNVTHKKALLRNTFLKEFQPVPGMSNLYQAWQQQFNASFHFVSSSPYQLFTDLEDFRRKYSFPEATFHLKTIRPKDKSLLLKLFSDPLKSKNATISAILERFPDRKFILVGDSGEKDPEVYGHLARTYATQIVSIFIRKIPAKQVAKQAGKQATEVDQEAVFAERMEQAFAGIPSSQWRVFEDAEEVVNDTLLLSEEIIVPTNV